MKVGKKDGGAMNIFIEGGKVEQVSKFKYPLNVRSQKMVELRQKLKQG